MKTVNVNGEECAVNAEGGYVPLRRISAVDQMRDDLVERIVNQAAHMGAALRRFKDAALADVATFADLSAEQHGVRLRGPKGGFSLASYDGLAKIVVDNDTVVAVNEKVSVAREAIFACVRRWSQGADANLAVLVQKAFEADRQGHLSLARLLALRTYAIDDPEWRAAMDALSAGLTAAGTKTYIRYYRRDSPEAAFGQIALG